MTEKAWLKMTDVADLVKRLRADMHTAIPGCKDCYSALHHEAANALENIVRHERAELAYLFGQQAQEHESAARESDRNDEPDDAEAHRFEARVWQRAEDLVSARIKPVAARPAAESAEIPEDEIAF